MRRPKTVPIDQPNFAEYLAKTGAYTMLRQRAWPGLALWWRDSQHGADMMWVARACGIDHRILVRAAIADLTRIEHLIPAHEADVFEARKHALDWVEGKAPLIRVSEACERLWYRISYWCEDPYDKWASFRMGQKVCPWYSPGWVFLSAAWACEDGCPCVGNDIEGANILRCHVPYSMIAEAVTRYASSLREVELVPKREVFTTTYWPKGHMALRKWDPDSRQYVCS